MSESLRKVDHAALRVNQITIITLNILAFVLNLPWLAALVALAMVVGTVLKTPGFGFIYRYVLKPAGLVKPDVLMDNPEPHRFSQGLGGVFMIAGSLALWAGYAALGWGLVWLVAALAALNAFGGFCVGCAMYYWLGRLSLPGFQKSPPAGTFPGMRAPSRKRCAMNLDGFALESVYRLLIAAAIVLAGVMLYRGISSATLARARSHVPGLERVRPGVPVLLYFTTPTCAPCKTVQRPAIQRLQERIGERLEVVEVDAASQPEIASQWGVLSVPTTFVIDALGNPRYVNHGVAPLDKLQRQFAEIIS